MQGQQQTSDYYFKIFGEFKSDSYFSKYGMDVLLSIFILFIILLLFMYMKTQSNKNYYIYGKYTDENGEQQSIWNREKCKPHILPFSGNLHRPDPSKSAFETTMNNFEECIKSPFDASNLEMLNPFRLLANTISVLLTTLTALISGIRSYIQSVLDTLFTRFKENKKTLSDIQIDIMKRFIDGVYDKLNSSFRSLRDSIGTFTDEVYENYLEASLSQIRLTVRSYFKYWFETAIIKQIGSTLITTALTSFRNGDVFNIVFSLVYLIVGGILLGISSLLGAEMQEHYNLLSGARQTVPAPIGGAANWVTDKDFSLFYGKEYETKTTLDEAGNAETKTQKFGDFVSGGNVSNIINITKPSIGDLLNAYDYFKNNGLWQEAIDTNRKMIREIRGIDDNEWAQMKKEGKKDSHYDSSWDGSLIPIKEGIRKYEKNIEKFKTYIDNGNRNGQIQFIKDNIRNSALVQFNSSGMEIINNKKREAEKLAGNCQNLDLYFGNDYVLLLNLTWNGFIIDTPEMTTSIGVINKTLLDNVHNDGRLETYVTKDPTDDDEKSEKKYKITNRDHRHLASRGWFWYNEPHHFDRDKGATIIQGSNGSYADGDVKFTLRAWKMRDTAGDFTYDGGNLESMDWKREYSFSNYTIIDGECMSGCFGKNTEIKMNNGKMKAIYKIKPGDILENNNKVNGFMKCKLAGKSLYKLNETIVTSHHRVLHNNEFIHAYMHPNAIKYNHTDYDDNFVYCLTTDSKTIKINEEIFTDWDELNEKDIINLKHKLENEFERELENHTTGKTIHKYIDSGFHPYTSINMQKGKPKYIKNIKCGDVLENGNKVSAVIKIDAADIPIYKHSINDVSIFGTQNLVYNNDNNTKTTYYTEKERELYKPEKTESIKYLYHILTDKNEFNINKITFACYNKNLEIFL